MFVKKKKKKISDSFTIRYLREIMTLFYVRAQSLLKI